MSDKKIQSKFDAKMIGIIVGVALSSMAIGYGVGWLQGNFRVDDALQQVEREQELGVTKLRELDSRLSGELGDVRERSKAQIDELRQARDGFSRQTKLLEARRQLSRVLLNLDDRNFGIAQQHLERASSLIGEAGGEDTDLQALSKTLSEARVVVAGNLQQQRTSFRTHADRFDALLDRATPGSAEAR